MTQSAAPAQPLIAFQGVRKSYDGVTPVVRDLNLEINEGEFVTLLGPSGSGKTTTLMMLAGFEVPSAGDIFVEGRRINEVPSYHRNFGMVFQNYALFPHMTVAQNLAFPLRMHKFNRAEIAGRVERALEMVKLSGLGDRHPAQLSGGQQQRVALARALVFEPRMVLMDEPLGALDKQLREHMQLEIRELHAKLGLTILYITHDQSEALTLSDRIAIFNHGRIEQIGSAEAVYDRPETAFVAQFMGENNVLQGRVAGIRGRELAITTGSGAGLVLAARGPAEVGAAVQVMIRPERLILGGEGLVNRLTGHLRDVIYQGDHLRLVIETAPNEQLTARVSHAQAVALPAIGAGVTVGFAAEHGVSFPA